MKKLLLGVALSFLLVTNGYCADVSRSHVFVDAEILTAALLNGEFDPIVTALNDISGDQLATNLAITSSGTQAFSGTFGVSGTFNATGTSINLGNGGTDLLTLNCAGGITFTPAATWTFTGAQTVSGTWANLGIITTADINGGTIDGAVIGGASAAAATVTTLTTGGKLTAGANEIECSNVDITGGSITGITDLAVADGGTGLSTGDNLIKGWASVTYSGGVPTLNDSYNVSGITDTATCQLTVTWDTDFLSTNYAVIATPRQAIATSAGDMSTLESIAVGSCVIRNSQASGTSADPLAIYCMAIGDQ